MDLFDYPLNGVNLIEASAGTGKTWTICGLYLRLLLERQLHVKEILVVTFTNAAAAELRERVRGHLLEALAGLHAETAYSSFVPRLVATVLANTGKTADDIRNALEAALHAFDEASIFTIHGFCQRVLSDTPFASSLPFGLELLQEGEQALRLAAVRDFWRRYIAWGSLHPALIDYLIAEQDSPERWEPLFARHLAKPLSKILWPPWPQDMQAALDRSLRTLQWAFDRAKSLWSAPDQVSGPTDILLKHLNALNGRVFTASSIAIGAAHWDSYLGRSKPSMKRAVREDKLHLFCTPEIKPKKNHPTPYHPFFDAAHALLEAKEAVVEGLALARLALLRDMLEQAACTLSDEKRRARLVSFDDLLGNVYRALTEGDAPWIAASLRSRYPVALIDEFQDTDPLQFALFDRIYQVSKGRGGSNPFFVVGDPKQAIYSFRNADLHTYLNARTCASQCHTLRHNQRSVAPLIESLNALFSANPSAFLLEGLAYDPVAEGDKPRKTLLDQTEDHAAALRLWQLPLQSRAESQRRVVQATAAEVARLIAAGHAGQITLDGKGLTPGQIAILVKSHRQGRLVRDALIQRGVGSVELSQESIFKTQDARDLERVLLAILEPSQASLLFAALSTEMMGYDAIAIAALREDEDTLMAVMTRFEQYHQFWARRGFGFLLRRWLDGEQIVRRLLVRDDGERRLTNLLHLAELLQEASSEHPAPHALMRWFNEAKVDDNREVTQLRLESDRNLVQIVTIHRAKGLEYDFVFCPFLWDGYQHRFSEPEGIGYHDDQGEWVIDFRPATLSDQAIQCRRAREADAELMRLFYVALTRAVQRCYLVVGSYFRRYPKSISFVESSRSLLNWLVAGAGLSYDEWLETERTPEEIAAAWQTLSDNHAPALRMEALPEEGADRIIELPTQDPNVLVAPVPPLAIPRGWQFASFSSLQRGGHPSEGTPAEWFASDHDGSSLRYTLDRSTPDAFSVDDFLSFPRGAAAGECVHAVFERVDFTDPAGWELAIQSALADHPLTLAGSDPLPASLLLPRMLGRLLIDVMGTRLPEGIVLGELSKANRLIDLAFHFPMADIYAHTLNTWLFQHGYATDRVLTFARIHGYLRGYIDLVFRHQGRFYLLDWKSNHLGFTAPDYDFASMKRAMDAHDYHLQYLLYSVALHRYLASRLLHYDFDQHFGGIFYLFVRGIRLDWQTASSPLPGVYFHRPARDVIASLDDLLGGTVF